LAFKAESLAEWKAPAAASPLSKGGDNTSAEKNDSRKDNAHCYGWLLNVAFQLTSQHDDALDAIPSSV
jgi:hypothetical protein